METFEDTLYQQRQRHQLVAEIQGKGISDERVLDAVATVPRHLFMAPHLFDKAYIDKAFPIAKGQTISQPYTVAYQTQLLHVEKGDSIMEIGTGSAYQACILAAMGAEVYTIERHRKLFEKNKTFPFLQTFNNIHFFYGDGYEGLPHLAPFDKILITAAAPQIPPKLLDQLKVGGTMVLPLGVAPVQLMVRITLRHDGSLKEEHFDKFSFVPMLEGKE